MKKRFLSIVLAVIMVVSLLAVTASAKSYYTDTAGHWGEPVINLWTEAGIVSGFPDGSFHPDELLTRAQAAVVFSNLLKMKETADTSNFTDMKPGWWYTEPIAKCVHNGILQGTSPTTMNPDDYLTTTQMMVMLCRALGIKEQDTATVPFDAIDDVPFWAVGSVNALSNRGYLGNTEGWFLSTGNYILRAGVMQMMANVIGTYVDKPGTVTGATSGVTLVVSDGVTVIGDLEGVVVACPEPSEPDAKQPVVTLDGTNAEEVAVVTNSEVRLIGRARVGEVTLLTSAKGAKLTTEKGTSAEKVTVKADDTTVQGDGEVKAVDVNGNNTSVTTKNTQVTTSENATGTTVNGTDVPANQTINSSEESSSGSSGAYTKRYRLALSLVSNDDATKKVSGTATAASASSSVLADAFTILLKNYARETESGTMKDVFDGEEERQLLAQMYDAYEKALVENMTDWQNFVDATEENKINGSVLLKTEMRDSINKTYSDIGEGEWEIAFTTPQGNLTYTATLTISYN